MLIFNDTRAKNKTKTKLALIGEVLGVSSGWAADLQLDVVHALFTGKKF